MATHVVQNNTGPFTNRHFASLLSHLPLHPPSGYMGFLPVPSICPPPHSTLVPLLTPLCPRLLSPAGRQAPRGHGTLSTEGLAQLLAHPKGSMGICERNKQRSNEDLLIGSLLPHSLPGHPPSQPSVPHRELPIHACFLRTRNIPGLIEQCHAKLYLILYHVGNSHIRPTMNKYA